jgi:DNA-binding PucR family transcriptional regulator
MITPALQRLIDHDARHHTDYVGTLAAYLACMGRLPATAARLTIHRNTLDYRMKRIQALAGESLDDPNNRLALELGIRLLELRRGADPPSSHP